MDGYQIKKIALLTSSRADYSIYFPLLKELQKAKEYDLEIIAFGTHVSQTHGNTINKIKDDGFNISHTVGFGLKNDTPQQISKEISRVTASFSDIWHTNNYDLVFCLGDRYEMFAAISSGLPFNIQFAHIHGGESTLGAIDNVYRHSISLMSKLHFCTTEEYKKRIVRIIESDKNVYNVGALSVDNIKSLDLMSTEDLKRIFNIDFSRPTILSTFHPETVSFNKNKFYIKELLSSFNSIKGHTIVITMPNADTMGNYIRAEIEKYINVNNNVTAIESMGTIGYLSAMKHCSFLLGNTSSGFVEANCLSKYVINLGDRQKGRIITPNIINSPIIKNDILKAINTVKALPTLEKSNFYGEGNTAKKILNVLNSYFNA